MLQNVLNQIKKLDAAQIAKDLRNINPKDLVQEIKAKAQDNLEQLRPEQLVSKASTVVSQAMASTEDELMKGLSAAVHLALQGAEGVTPEEKREAASILLEFEKTPKGLVDHLKETSGLVLESLPRSLDDLRHLRQCLTKGLVDEARKRIAARESAKHQDQNYDPPKSPESGAAAAKPFAKGVEGSQDSRVAAVATNSTTDREVNKEQVPATEKRSHEKHASQGGKGFSQRKKNYPQRAGSSRNNNGGSQGLDGE